MSRTTLRPCLKHTTDLDPPRLRTVLSPSRSARLCQTHLTHSAATYDRAPIVVLPNACALPERNGRTYTPNESCAARRNAAPSGFVAAGGPAAPRAPKPPQSRIPPDACPRSCPTSPPAPNRTSRISAARPLFLPTSHRLAFTTTTTTTTPSISIVVDGNTDPAAALAFLPHANEREKPRSRSKTRGTRTMRKSEFALPELDGCLGGF
ncbi:hypothetical protein EI94DRAFT_1782560 [Lactarius quietus]|nr:hypothetical protein EI94DRAFT_1782560 [Lactarius quietus]